MRLLVSGSTKTVGRLVSRRPGHLGHLLTPRNRNSVSSMLATGLPWAADNGAFSGFDRDGFAGYLAKVANQPRCLWVVCPDAVGDAKRTLDLFDQWSERVRETGHPVAFVGQDGAEDSDLPWDRFGCWFIGGSTSWKLSRTSCDLVAEAKARGKLVHMGRVNSFKRIEIAHEWGCDSVDGSAASKWGDKYIHRFLAWLASLDQQPVLFGGAP